MRNLFLVPKDLSLNLKSFKMFRSCTVSSRWDILDRICVILLIFRQFWLFWVFNFPSNKHWGLWLYLFLSCLWHWAPDVVLIVKSLAHVRPCSLSLMCICVCVWSYFVIKFVNCKIFCMWSSHDCSEWVFIATSYSWEMLTPTFMPHYSSSFIKLVLQTSKNWLH